SSCSPCDAVLSWAIAWFEVYSDVDRKIKSSFARRTGVSKRLPPATTGRWRQSGKSDQGALGRDGTRAEVCHHRHGADRASETTRASVALGDPVTWCLAGTGRCDGGWVRSPFQMAKDLADYCALRDDGDDSQRPLMAKRAVGHIQCKHAPQEPGPGPIR